MDYREFQKLTSSNKIVLATLAASRRFMGWVEESAPVYKLTNFKQKVVNKVTESGKPYTENTEGIESLDSGEYYLDRENDILYIRSFNDEHPNTLFITVFVTFFFSNEPVVLPFDLDSGFEVYWEPILKSTSDFGNNIDTINQTGESIDGTGTLNLINDNTFWTSIFDRWTFENKDVSIYSWNREVPLNQIQILFKGSCVDKKYGPTSISFQLKDQFRELRQNIPLPSVSEISLSTTNRAGDDQQLYKQRLIYGRVFGHRLVNIDRELDGYPLIGTVEGVLDGETESIDLIFTSTQFLSQVSPGDKLIINGIELDVERVVDNETIIFENPEDITSTFGPIPIYIKPANPKRYMNRYWSVCGHTVREPSTTTSSDCTIDTLFVETNRDIYPGDTIFITNYADILERAVVSSVEGTDRIKLKTSLPIAPPPGLTVFRPAIQNLKIDNIPLVYFRDYTWDNGTGILKINEDAEINAAPIKNLGFTATFTESDRQVTGLGFSQLRPGWMIGIIGHTQMFQIHSIEDDEHLTLVTPATFTDTNLIRYKDLIITEDSVISCDILGKTEDGTPDGILIKTAPQICRDLIAMSPLGESYINEESFAKAAEVAYQELGMVIPKEYNAEQSPTFIDAMNRINKSVFGSIVIRHTGPKAAICYNVLQPKKDIINTLKFSESDMFGFQFNSTSKNTVKNVIIQYQPREYDPIVGESSYSVFTKTNTTSEYVIETSREKIIETNLTNERDARIAACRWSLILSDSAGSLTFTTKLQAAHLNVGDIIEVEHSKMFQRLGSVGNRRLFLIESIKKNGFDVKLECVDFSNTFNRIACISDTDKTFSEADENDKLYFGFITDEYGMQDNDPETFNQNLIW